MALISKFYKDNEDKIEGMTYYEYEGNIDDYKLNDKKFLAVINKKE